MPERTKYYAELLTLATARKLIAELIGTALLVLVGCMGCMRWSSGAPSSIQIGTAFGMVVMFVIQIFGHISGAHVNPSVTLCGVITGMLSIPVAIAYVFAQMFGAIGGYGLLILLTPTESYNNNTALCVTMPENDVSVGQAIIIEAIITSVLILVTCAVWDPCTSHNSDSVPLKFGFTVAAIAMNAGPYTGGSMNPARSFGPALWNNKWDYHWIYWVGPLLGSGLSSLLYHIVFRKHEQAIPKEPNYELD